MDLKHFPAGHHYMEIICPNTVKYGPYSGVFRAVLLTLCIMLYHCCLPYVLLLLRLFHECTRLVVRCSPCNENKIIYRVNILAGVRTYWISQCLSGQYGRFIQTNKVFPNEDFLKICDWLLIGHVIDRVTQVFLGYISRTTEIRTGIHKKSTRA